MIGLQSLNSRQQVMNLRSRFHCKQ